MHRAHHPRQHGAVADAGVEHPQRRRAGMDAAEFQPDPIGDHPLFAAGMDEQQVFLPVLEKPEIAAGIALFGRDLQAARRRHPARHGGRDIGLDPVQRVDGDALALAQAMHQLAVIDRPAAEGRFRHIRLAAEFGDLAAESRRFSSGLEGWDGRVGSGGSPRVSYHHLPNGGMIRQAIVIAMAGSNFAISPHVSREVWPARSTLSNQGAQGMPVQRAQEMPGARCVHSRVSMIVAERKAPSP